MSSAKSRSKIAGNCVLLAFAALLSACANSPTSRVDAAARAEPARAQGMTRFAALLGVQQATVSRYISGTKIPPVTVVLKIRDLSKGAVALDDWAPEKKIRRRDALLPGV